MPAGSSPAKKSSTSPIKGRKVRVNPSIPQSLANNKLTLAKQSPSNDPDVPVLSSGYIQLLPCEGGYSSDKNWVVIPAGPIVKADHLHKLVNADLISDGVIDGYLALLSMDIATSMPMQASDDFAFVCTDAIFGHSLVNAPRNSAGISPPARSNERFGVRTLWFEKVCSQPDCSSSNSLISLTSSAAVQYIRQGLPHCTDFLGTDFALVVGSGLLPLAADPSIRQYYSWRRT